MNYNNRKFKLYIFWGIFFCAISIFLIVLPIVFPELIMGGDLNRVFMISGVVLAVFGLLFLLAACGELYKRRKNASDNAETEAHAPKRQKKASAPMPTQRPQAYQQPAEPVPEPITYQPEDFQFFPQEPPRITAVAPGQSITDKFNEIAKMGRAQFVVYVARLFSIKGYSVKYTPVMDNFDIDLIVEKMGVVIAVGCILTDKILSDKDIFSIAAGRSHYQTKNVIALTNMYFDRTALNYAKDEKMSLIDRNILAEDFMTF